MNIREAYPGQKVAVKQFHQQLSRDVMPAKLKKITRQAGHGVTHEVEIVDGPMEGQVVKLISRRIIGPWTEAHEESWQKALTLRAERRQKNLAEEIKKAQLDYRSGELLDVLRMYIPAESLEEDDNTETWVWTQDTHRRGKYRRCFMMELGAVEQIVEVLRDDLRRTYE